jgi:D-psicose/D-tagatose/L-ribulose 3-epimerase
MRISLCNEVIREMPFDRQCAFARAVGYEGLEVAPFTLGDEPHRLSAARRAELRAAVAQEGMAITGLHWLLVVPEGLSVTSLDAAVRGRTLDVMKGLIDLCADLGGQYLVHGSPRQRALEAGSEDLQRGVARECFSAAAEHAAAAGVTYCIEPLAPEETNFLVTVREAADLVTTIGNPALRTMIDCAAALRSADGDPVPLLTEWLPSGLIAHVHLNDPNRRGPGQGSLRFEPILRTLIESGYDGCAGVEPFIYEPDGSAAAARAIGYLRGCLERAIERDTNVA